MVLRIGEYKIRVTKNENNRFWNPMGMFWNVTEVLIEGEWYRCGLVFREEDGRCTVVIDHPMKVDRLTNRITEVLKDGQYAEFEISKRKASLIKFLENRHQFNRISFRIRKGVYGRRRTFLIFSLAIVPSMLFYIINSAYQNVIIHLIAENTWVQTFFFFLTISGFISIFHPFTFKKEINSEDMKALAREMLDEENQKEIDRKRQIV